MKTCQKCNSKFKIHIEINGKVKNLQRRKFCLECSPFNLHNTKDLVNTKPQTKKHCPRCQREHGIEMFYLKKNGDPLPYCKTCTNEQTVERTKLIKRKAIEYKGGKCIICGYNKCNRNMHFHHLDRSTKSFPISHIRTASLDRLKPELDKCILLCSNCHGEVEDGLVSIPSPGLEPGTSL